MSLHGGSTEFMTPEDVEREFRLPVNTQKSWRSRNRFGLGSIARKFGSKVVYPRAHLVQIIEKSRVVAAHAADVPEPVAVAWRAVSAAVQARADAAAQYGAVGAAIQRARDAIAAPTAHEPICDDLRRREYDALKRVAAGTAPKEDLEHISGEVSSADERAQLLADAACAASERLPELERELAAAAKQERNAQAALRVAEAAFAQTVAAHFRCEQLQADRTAKEAEAIALAAGQHANQVALEQEPNPLLQQVRASSVALSWVSARYIHAPADAERAREHVKHYIADVSAALGNDETEKVSP